MKPAYMGGVRGYQSAVHRPGMGLSDNQSRRRRGFRVKAAFIASFATVAAMVALAFVGSAQF